MFVRTQACPVLDPNDGEQIKVHVLCYLGENFLRQRPPQLLPRGRAHDFADVVVAADEIAEFIVVWPGLACLASLAKLQSGTLVRQRRYASREAALRAARDVHDEGVLGAHAVLDAGISRPLVQPRGARDVTSGRARAHAVEAEIGPGGVDVGESLACSDKLRLMLQGPLSKHLHRLYIAGPLRSGVCPFGKRRRCLALLASVALVPTHPLLRVRYSHLLNERCATRVKEKSTHDQAYCCQNIPA